MVKESGLIQIIRILLKYTIDVWAMTKKLLTKELKYLE
jgi:hypothetical protein